MCPISMAAYPKGSSSVEASTMGKTKEKKKNSGIKEGKMEEKGHTEVQESVDNDGEQEKYTKKKKQKSKKKKEEEITVRMETLPEQTHKMSPFVGYFPTSFNPLQTRTGGDDERAQAQHSVRVYRHVKRSNRLQLVVSPNNGSKLDFVGTNYSGEAATPQICTYALGLLDKVTQTLKIVPVASNKLFRLEPTVRGSNLVENEQLETTKEESMPEKKAERMRELTLMYSTKKNINAAKKLESLRQKEDPNSQDVLDRKLEGIQINKEDFEVVDNTKHARNIPPHDMSASAPQMVYPLEKIIFSGEWDYLLDIFELPQGCKGVTPEHYPAFVCNRVHKLDHIENETDNRQLACIFSYMTHLIKFKDKHSMEGFSSAKHHKIPSILLQKFSSMFAIADSKRLSDDKRDLLISYVLVLTLFADNFRTDPSDIARDLKMDVLALRLRYEYLGCKFVREGKLLLATLPAPLKFPEQRRKRRR